MRHIERKKLTKRDESEGITTVKGFTPIPQLQMLKILSNTCKNRKDVVEKCSAFSGASSVHFRER